MNMEDFAQEARRLSEADYSTYTEERVLIREVLRSAAELGEAILKKRNAEKNIPYKDIAVLYNNICGGKLPSVLLDKFEKSETRLSHIRARISDGYTLDDFKTLFERAAASPFLCGNNERNWRADFDWLIKPGNMLRILEGIYTTSSTRASGGADHSYDLDMFDSFALKNTPKL